MSQDSTANILLPPRVPLHKLKEAVPMPVTPPGLPGLAQDLAGAVIAQPLLPKAAAGVRKKKERRIGLAGLEPGDPRSTYHLVMLGLKNTLSTAPKLAVRYWWKIIIVFGIWFVLGTFSAFKLSQQVPALTAVWFALEKVVLFLVFLTASYNNFIAKAVYAAVIIRVGVPLALRVRREGASKVINEFKSIIPGLKENWACAGNVATSIFIGFAGLGAFISNFLTRNNRIDKIAVSLVLAIALLKALSDGTKSLPFMVSRVVLKDFFFVMAKPSPVRNHHIYVMVSGLALGLLCSVPFTQLSKIISDYVGYIIGAIAMLAAAALFYFKKTPENTTTTVKG